MNYSSKLVLALFSCLSYFMNYQNNISSQAEDYTLITETVEMYFDGWLTGDTLKLGRAMHSSCKLKNVKEDQVKIYDRSTYLGFFSPRPRLENASGKILSIDVTGPVASVKCQLETSSKIYTDYFNMMKLDEDWYIVDKISTNQLK